MAKTSKDEVFLHQIFAGLCICSAVGLLIMIGFMIYTMIWGMPCPK